MTLVLARPEVLQGAQLATREEVLAAVYPGAEIVAERIFLTESERREAGSQAGEPIPSSLVARYKVLREGRLEGYAYVDTHLVRTKKESLLICLNDDGSVRRVEVTAFQEPPEYLASPAWLRQYEKRSLDEGLRLNREIRPIAGATLTAAATNQAVRRVLAIDRALRGRN